MITLPPNMTETKYQGYYWDVVAQKLYSLKTGVLRPVKYKQPWMNTIPGYQVSDNGVRKKLSLEYLASLRVVDGTVPVLPPVTRKVAPKPSQSNYQYYARRPEGYMTF